MKLTQSLVRRVLNYDSKSGELTWRVAIARRLRVGMIAGVLSRRSGHRSVQIKGETTTVSRIIWLYVYGELPQVEVEHINGDGTDCRLSNLRLHKSRKNESLTINRLKQILRYESTTGLFYSKEIHKQWKSGRILNYTAPDKRQSVLVDGNRYRAHRLAWFYTHGYWPSKHIDHINGDPSDNRLCNLREATRTQNMANSKRPITNTTGYKGVSWHKGASKYQVHIRHAGKIYYLGLFTSAKQGHKAYAAATKRLNGEFARIE